MYVPRGTGEPQDGTPVSNPKEKSLKKRAWSPNQDHRSVYPGGGEPIRVIISSTSSAPPPSPPPSYQYQYQYLHSYPASPRKNPFPYVKSPLSQCMTISSESDTDDQGGGCFRKEQTEEDEDDDDDLGLGHVLTFWCPLESGFLCIVTRSRCLFRASSVLVLALVTSSTYLIPSHLIFSVSFHSSFLLTCCCSRCFPFVVVSYKKTNLPISSFFFLHLDSLRIYNINVISFAFIILLPNLLSMFLILRYLLSTPLSPLLPLHPSDIWFAIWRTFFCFCFLFLVLSSFLLLFFL